MPRYAFVEQHNEEDCGAACVAMVARHYGKTPPFAMIRSLVGTGQQGTTLLGLKRGACELGFHCQALQTDVDATFFDDIGAISLPAILHWQGNHWVVLYAVEKRRVVIADPASGVQRLPREAFLEAWGDGILLSLQPDYDRLLLQPDDRSKQHFLSRLQRMVAPHWPLLLRVLAINAVIGLIGLSIPLLMQILTDDILVRRDVDLLGVLGIGMVAIYLFRSLIDFLQGQIASFFCERLELDLVLDYGSKLLRMPMPFFNSHRSGEVLSRITDLRSVNSMFNAMLLGLPSALFVALISLVVMLIYSAGLTLISIIAFLIITAIQLSFWPASRAIAMKSVIKNADNQGYLVELFRGAQVLKSTNAGFQAWEEYQRNFGELARLSWRSTKLKLVSEATVETLSALLHIGILIYGSTIVLRGELSIGQLLAFSGLSMNVLLFFTKASDFAVQVIADASIFSRLTEVLDSPGEEVQAASRHWVDLDGGTGIACNRLSFAHPGRRQLLNQVNLSIPGGRNTALIGGSGSGKSTLAQLLAGMITPSAGSIRYGSVYLNDLALTCLREQVCLVTQDSHFFNRTILENFLFTHPQVSYPAIVQACEVAMADAFISDLPAGYQTMLGEFGTNLSGGQRQRLAIARALVNNPPILILDESTSALDPVLEAQLLEQLLRHRQGMTTVLISHRSSVISRCDWIIHLEQGVVRFEGSLRDAERHPQLRRFLPAEHHA
ncbi:MAG: peptidase domain-containing ABC transporter [Synechococcaceae cyanobacterium]|nr:peptidase domain-containing ABC transporter [Synechococcaceae cyanobacterium]